jgi:hypothetical protein
MSVRTCRSCDNPEGDDFMWLFPMTLLAQPLILPEISMAETDKVEAGRSLDKTENALL